MRYREESHETDPTPPPTVSRVSPKVFTQLCKADMFTCSYEFHSVITCFKDRIYQLKNKDKYAQSRLRGQVMYRFHKLHLVCSRAHFLDLYNRKLFCSLKLGVIREGTKSEKENKWTGRRFGIVLRLGINFNESWVELSFCEGLFEKVSLNSEVMRCYLRTAQRKTLV